MGTYESSETMLETDSIESSQLELTRSIAYFDTVYQAYQQAEAQSEQTVEQYFQIANSVFCLRFAGIALLPLLTRAIAHLAIAPVAQPDFTICLTSSRETGVPQPAPAWQDYQYQRRGEVRGFVNERIYTAKHWGSAALMVFDRDRDLGLYWVTDHRQIPYWEVGAPLLSLFNLCLAQRRVQLVHGAAVGLPTGGVLLVGKGGSGKSTTALACLNSDEASQINSDLMYASDDYCLITPEPSPTVFSLYNTGKKNADDLDRLPFLRSRLSNPDRLHQEKALYFIYEQFPAKLLRRFPLKATLIPRVTGQVDTTLEATSTAMGMMALVPSTIIQIGGAGKTACDLMTQTLTALPCYFLNIGTDISQIPRTIQAFLQHEALLNSAMK